MLNICIASVLTVLSLMIVGLLVVRRDRPWGCIAYLGSFFILIFLMVVTTVISLVAG